MLQQIILKRLLRNIKTKYPDKIYLKLHKLNHKDGRLSILKADVTVESKYIVNMDGDDYWCDDGKIEKQINFLNNNPDLYWCCSCSRYKV